MKSLLTLLFSIVCLAATAQLPEPTMLGLWGIGGNSAVGPLVSPQADGGFIICVGATTNVGNIDSFCALSGDKTVFLKYNSNASAVEWTKCYFENADDSGFGYMRSTPDGGNILCGSRLDATHDFLIHKETASGTVLWSKVYGDSAEAIIRSVLATQDGGFVMAGETYYTNSDFPIHYGSSGDEDIAVVRVDSNGNKKWSKVIGGSSIDLVVAVLAAPGDGCYLAGTTLSNDYDCTGNHGGDDAYLVRLDKDGNIIWHDDIGGSGGDEGDAAFSDGKGGVIMAGASESTDGDRTVFPPYGCPVWALEVDSSQNILWNNCYGGGGGNCYANAICRATDGSIWIAGVSTNSGYDVDTSYGVDDAWIVHADDTGKLLNAKVLGSHLWDRGEMIYPLSNENVIAGGFYDTAGGSFSNIAWYHGMNAFLTVFAPQSQTDVPVLSQNNAMNIYPNPATCETNIAAANIGDYHIVIADLLGRIQYEAGMAVQLQISLGNWQRGIYCVQVTDGNGNKTVKKLIVQ